MKKLTLTAEPEVIDMAKRLAEKRGVSVSAMFSAIVRSMARPAGKPAFKIGPLTQSVTGIARPVRGKTDRQLIEDVLLERFAP